MKKLKANLEKAITAYIQAFEKKHGLECDWHFIGGDLFGVLQFGDYFFNISNVVYDIDHELPVGVITEWHSDQLEYSMNNPDSEESINLEWYSRGLRFEDLAGK
jgi:hypothetical protein